MTKRTCMRLYLAWLSNDGRAGSLSPFFCYHHIPALIAGQFLTQRPSPRTYRETTGRSKGISSVFLVAGGATRPANSGKRRHFLSLKSKVHGLLTGINIITSRITSKFIQEEDRWLSFSHIKLLVRKGGKRF